MTRRFLLGLALVATAATLMLVGGAPRAQAQNVTCTGVMNGAVPSTIIGFSGLKAPSTISGNVTVPSGASCTLAFYNVKGNVQAQNGASLTLNYVNVSGNVQVQNGGTFLINGYNEPSTVGGNVQATNCGSALLEGNVTVGGNLQIQGCKASGPNGFQGPGITVKGNFQCTSNSGGCEAWLGNVGGNVQMQSNGSTGATDVSLVMVGGNLQCNSNSPATTHAHGPSWVSGNVQGDCAGFNTTSTSISTTVTPVASCAALASLPGAGFPVANTVIVSAVDTPKTTTLPERCIIVGYVNDRISAVDNCEYQDRFQVQLPIATATLLPAGWNGRFMFQGGGGTEGSVPTATGTDSGSAGSNFGVTNGYAVASQDGGHETSQQTAALCPNGYGNGNEFYLDPAGTIAQAYQSIQVTTLDAKYLTDEFYGSGPAHSYWVGCSTGGRQGMVMSENYPQYFDGIVAGDPVYDLQAIGSSAIWGIQQIDNLGTPSSFSPGPAPEAPQPHIYNNFPASDQALFETALLQTCDGLDGVNDGVIDNLPACKAAFDPATATYMSGGVTLPLQCPGAKNATCLSPAQIQATKNINVGPRTTAGMSILAPAGATAPDHVDNTIQGYAYDGGWMTTVSIPARKIGTPTGSPGDYSLGGTQFPYAFIMPPDPELDPTGFNFTTDQGLYSQSSPIVSFSTSLDITKFVNYGHKIIWYHGLSDPGPPVLGTILYYNAMANQHGGLQAAQAFSRLYPVPNMDHCTGGATTDQFDMLTPIMQWVENGTPPGPVPAKGTNFNATTYQVGFVTGSPDNAPTTRNRPLCPYPQEARFVGSTTMTSSGPVATNPADLADVTKYSCYTPPTPPYLE